MRSYMNDCLRHIGVIPFVAHIENKGDYHGFCEVT